MSSRIPWQRLSESVLQYKDSHGNIWQLSSHKGKRKGTFYGVTSYYGYVVLRRNGKRVGDYYNVTWGEVKHLRPRQFDWLLIHLRYFSPTIWQPIVEEMNLDFDSAGNRYFLKKPEGVSS